MSKTLRIALFAPDGSLVWETPQDGSAACERLAPHSSANALRRLLGLESPRNCSRGEVLAQAERLQFVSRDGCSKGFLTVLPRGLLLENCVDSFNLPLLRDLDAVQMEFPLVFDIDTPSNRALTETFESQGKMFALGGKDSARRLAYAADPGLFSWLADKQLDERRLPFAIYSPLPVLRRFRSGEVGGLDRPRQYRVHDVHIFVPRAALSEHFQHCLSMLAEATRFWFKDDFVQYLESDRQFVDRQPDFGSKAARAADQFTLLRVLDERKRYYDVKSGMMVDAGSGAAMLFNLQWDEVNPDRFCFQTKQGGDVGVIHCALAGGWSRLLPIFLGRGITGVSPQVIPWEVAADQIVVAPVSEAAQAAAAEVAGQLTLKGFRAAVSEDRGSVGKRLWRLRSAWQEHYCVIGATEAAGGAAHVESMCSETRYSIDEFTAQFMKRADRCRPATPLVRTTLPF